jgi:peptidoglycan/xylan/chitin deacetylase (PgdA/CDA1 family)
MYHYLSEPPEDADVYRLGLSTTPAEFESHLAFLRAEGYTSIDLYHLLDALTWGRPLPSRPIIITFDDGYRDNYDNAFPLLLEYGFTATFFVLTEPIDAGSERYLTWRQVEQMAAAGMGFEPHTKNHPDLRQKSKAFLVWEILGCAQTLEARLGRYPRFLAYPSGVYDDRVIEFLHEIHFWGAVTTRFGADHTWEGRFELRRVRISGGDDAAVLAAKLHWEPEPVPEGS